MSMIRAVTLDFFDTLATHRTGKGRATLLREHLAAARLAPVPWDRAVLFEIFDIYARSYRPSLEEELKHAVWIEMTAHLFARLDVRGAGADPARHAAAIREIMGSTCIALFDDALPALAQLRRIVPRIGIVSDWHRGLDHFCEELGIGSYLDVVVTSADAGAEKPDPRPIQVACAGLGVDPSEALHVGDRVEDVASARAAGCAAILLARGREPAIRTVPVIASLEDLPAHLRVRSPP